MGEHPFAQCRLHAIAEDAAGAAADEYVYQSSGHIGYLLMMFRGAKVVNRILKVKKNALL